MKSNRDSQNRPSTFAAVRPKPCDILAGVTQLHSFPSSLHRNWAKDAP
jgi:hypothetical protein